MAFCENHTDCILKLQDVDSRCKSNQHRIDDVEDEINGIKAGNEILHEMNKNIAILANNYDNQGKKIDVIEKDVKELKEQPVKRYDAITAAIIATAIGLVVGYMFNTLLGG